MTPPGETYRDGMGLDVEVCVCSYGVPGEDVRFNTILACADMRGDSEFELREAVKYHRGIYVDSANNTYRSYGECGAEIMSDKKLPYSDYVDQVTQAIRVLEDQL